MRSNLFKGMMVKQLGYYADFKGFKPETRFTQVSDYLSSKFNEIPFKGPDDVVHIFATSYGFLIARYNGEIRVTNVRICEYATSSWTPVEGDWIEL